MTDNLFYTSKKLGIIGEQIAENWLRKNKFKIIDKNLKIGKFGEIDFICKKNKIYYFIEVKSSFNHNISFPPEVHFTKQKLNKIVKMSELVSNQRNYSQWKIALLTISQNNKNVNINFYSDIQ